MPLAQPDTEEVKKFIYDKLLGHPRFSGVIAVSVQHYPSEYSATVWVGQEPDGEMREFVYQLESELASLNVPCSIIVRTDRELPFGGVYRLRTNKGEFSYRNYRLDPVRDEDAVYIFTLYRGALTYRLRMSLSGTLASMLRARNRLEEDRIVEVYLDRIRQEVERDSVKPDELVSIMFDSRDLRSFVSS